MRAFRPKKKKPGQTILACGVHIKYGENQAILHVCKSYMGKMYYLKVQSAGLTHIWASVVLAENTGISSGSLRNLC